MFRTILPAARFSESIICLKIHMYVELHRNKQKIEWSYKQMYPVNLFISHWDAYND